jgi:hypothetical protein
VGHIIEQDLMGRVITPLHPYMSVSRLALRATVRQRRRIIAAVKVAHELLFLDAAVRLPESERSKRAEANRHQQGGPEAHGEFEPRHYTDSLSGGLSVDVFKIVVVIALAAILVSLGKALFHLSSGKGDPAKTVRALTWRIGLSIGLLLLMLLAAHQGWIAPHGVGR